MLRAAKPAGGVTQAAAAPQRLSVQSLPLQTRVITYAYDGLHRLTGAHESPGSTYVYAYDLAGNRTDGGKTYNAANQITNAGYTYDNAGNLTGDGTAAATYDALGRMTARGGTTYTSNGDGVLVYDGTTRYTQDLASPLSQIVQTTQGSATTDYLYGLDRLAAVTGSTRTWYGTDALGSVRQTISDTGVPLGVVNYDPWGTVESGSVPTFGFTGELQDSASGLVNLRARWYSTASGTFTAFRWRTSESRDTMPYSHHPYAYALSNPINWMDPAGTCAVDDVGGPRACNPTVSFEEQLVRVLDNYGVYWELYDAATKTRGATALNLVFDREPDLAQRYQPGDSLSQLIETKYPCLDPDGVTNIIRAALGMWRLDAISRSGVCDTSSLLANAGMITVAGVMLGGPDEFMSPDRGSGGGEGRFRRAPEFPGGQITEGQFVESTLKYLGSGYREVSPGRYVSSDGMRQVRYGSHEVDGPIHHGHFEAYDRSYYNGGSVVENTRVIITP